MTMLYNAYLIEVLHVVVALTGAVLAAWNVRESNYDVEAMLFGRAHDGDARDAIIAAERFFASILVLAVQIAICGVGVNGMFSAPPPPDIASSAPTPFRGPYLVLENTVVLVSTLLTVKTIMRLRHRRLLRRQTT